MRLPERIVEGLAEMVVGDSGAFPYRSSSAITQFFGRCGFAYVHDGSTRRIWTRDVLRELNLGPAHTPDLPSDALLRVIDEMFDLVDFEKAGKSVQEALDALNKLLSRQGLAAYVDASGHCLLRNVGTGVNSSTIAQMSHPLSKEEIVQRQRVAAFLDSASEDETTEKLLVPLFRRLGFHRVTPSGHREKALEFGKDLWMKYQLPTGHWLYFCAQIKRDKIDASGSGDMKNVSTVLTQAKMAIEHPIFDPDANRKFLLDHIFIISAGEITRAARTWLVEHLDGDKRRHIIFMDREEFLNHSARILLDLQLDDQATSEANDVPF